MEEKIIEIENWQDNHKKLNSEMNYDEFMSIVIEMGNHIRILLILIANIIPQEVSIRSGYSKKEVFIPGLLSKIFKMYDSMIYHASQDQSDIVNLFARPLIESVQTLKFLIQNPEKIRDVQKSSFMPAVRNYKHLLELQQKQELTKLELGMLNKIKNSVASDGFDIDELVQFNRNDWNKLKPNLKELHTRVEGESIMYDFLHGNLSRFIHSDWQDIKFNHINIENEENNLYLANLRHTPISKAIIPLMTIPVLDGLLEYLSWKNFDPTKSIYSIVEKMFEINKNLVLMSNEEF